MNTLRKIVIVFLISLTALAPVVALAKVGVGVGLGKVNIDESLKPGGIYKLPTLPVLNTGDEAGDYEVEVTYLTDQPELRPAADWFTSRPNQFHLPAARPQGQEVIHAVKNVLRREGHDALIDVQLKLPVQSEPAHPAEPEAGAVVEAFVHESGRLFLVFRITGPQPPVYPQPRFLRWSRSIVLPLL